MQQFPKWVRNHDKTYSLTHCVSQTIWIRSSICLPVDLISTFCRHVSIFQTVLHLISAFVRLHIRALFSGSLFTVVEARRLALTRMTEAHFIHPLHHLHFPFYKPLISPPLSLTRSPSCSPRLSLKSLFSPLFHLIFSNLLRFPHLLSSPLLSLPSSIPQSLGHFAVT